MQIQWFGQAYTKIQAKNKNNNNITIACDPYNQSCGLTPNKFQAEIVTVSCDHPCHNNTSVIKNNPFVLENPGEYEVNGVFIYGIPVNDKTIFRFLIEGLNVVQLGRLDSELKDEQLEKLNNVDILLIPVGGSKQVLDGRAAKKLTSEIDPRIIIPICYQLPKLKEKLDQLEVFLKAAGRKPTKEEKLKISKKDLLTEETKIIVLGNN